MNNTISCRYRLGAHSVLQNWGGHNLCQTDSKFYYVEEGEIVVQIYGRTIKAGPGDLMLIPAQTVHSCWLTKESYAEKLWCHFSLRDTSGEFFERFVLEPVLHVPNRTVVKKLFRQLFSSHDMPSPQRELTSTAAICALVQYYFEHSEVDLCEILPDRIKQVANYIERHHAENITLEQLAQVAGYSITHLSRCFCDVMGMPPIRYLNNVRIEKAKYLLELSDEPIGKIMDQCGFTDAAYFSRYFKKMLGHSPQIYRELYRSNSARK